MSLRAILKTAFAVALCAACVTASADEQSPNIHPTTPYEYWKDYCELSSIIPNIYEVAGGSLWSALSAEAMLVHSSQIAPREDDSNFWHFTQTEPNINAPGTTIPFTGQVPFSGETRLAPNVRSGFLIAPNIIATAPHTNDFNPNNFVVVFNAAAKKDPVTQTCLPFDPEHIPASDIYHPRSTNPLIANTILHYFNIYGVFTAVDYAAFYLDRPATGQRYLRIRKNGGISSTDTLALIGHPFGMRTKLQYGIGYAGEETNASIPSFAYPIFNDFYLFRGMSGGPVYNLDRNYVETIVGSPHGSGCRLDHSDWYTTHTYWAMYDGCDDIPEPSGVSTAVYHQINNGPISALAELVPTPYLRVDPLNDVTYVLPINGTPSPSQTAYTATASPSETANTIVSATAIPAPAPGRPSLTLSNYTSSLAPGASTAITASATVPTGTPCGIYDNYVAIVDQTHQGLRDRMLHRFEIGMTDFSVAPDGTTDIYGITAPSSPANTTYTLTNTRPTAVTVNVTLGQSWLSFETGSSSVVNLAPAGQAGATKSVTIKVNAAAFALANGDHPFTVSFQGQGSCALNDPVQKNGVFHKGVLFIKHALDAFVFEPTPANAPVTDTLSVASSFCVTEVKVRFNSLREGVPLAQWMSSLRIYLDLDQTSSQLWNHNPLPGGWDIPTSSAPGETTETLILDQHQHLPPTGAISISVFGNKNSAGQWSFRLFDDGQGFGTGFLKSWELELRGVPWPGSPSTTVCI
jgi:hypothetical protein